MKINKLLFFLLALVSLNSCVEYVDNGTKQGDPETPEEQKYTAEHSNPTEAKYVGDKFVFKAMLNNVDVTSTTIFKINGTQIKGSSYIPHKVGSHSVIATMDNHEANFKFTVLEKDEEEPEPTGNRIEYGGKSYPVSNTIWQVFFTADGKNLETEVINDIPHTVWIMYTGNNANPANAKDYVIKLVFVPGVKQPDGTYGIAYPNEVSGSSIVHEEGQVYINGAKVYDSTNAAFVISGTGNAPFPVFDPSKFPLSATSNYTVTLTGASSGNSSELFWNGSHAITGVLAGKAKGFNDLKSFKPMNVSKDQIKNLKLKK